jgi:phosphoribosylglycinamide formyltransferase-1
MKKLAVFASGSGSNALKINDYFKKNNFAKIDCVITNNPDSGIVKKAIKWDCEIIIITKNNFYKDSNISEKLLDKGVDLVILAGFLWLIPAHLLSSFPQKIINIHPALLPKYGGKGMYGINVHRAVFHAKEKESGITIHTIDKEYDKGEIILQKSTSIESCKSPEEIADKILRIEHQNFAKTIHSYLKK